MDRYCCNVWRELNSELRNSKEDELQKLSDKGIPASVFSPIRGVLKQMDKYCPACGNHLPLNPVEEVRELVRATDESKKKYTTKVVKKKKKQPKIVKPTEPEPKAKVVHTKRKCLKCGSKGIFKMGGEDILCMNCHGRGYLDGATEVHDVAEEDGLNKGVIVRSEK